MMDGKEPVTFIGLRKKKVVGVDDEHRLIIMGLVKRNILRTHNRITRRISISVHVSQAGTFKQIRQSLNHVI